MELTPKEFAALTVQAVILGLLLGLLYSFVRVSRLFCLDRTAVDERRYTKCVLPFIGTMLGERKHRAKKGTFLFVLLSFLDISFCMIATVLMLLLAFVGNYGRVRWFIPFGALIGMVFFRVTVGKMIDEALLFLTVLFTAIRRMLVFIFFWPFRILFGGIRHMLIAWKQKIQKKRRERAEKRYAESEQKRLTEAAKIGFGCLQKDAS